MALIFWIIAGIVAGALAKRRVPGEGPGGAVGDLMTGVIGALAGSCLFQIFVGQSYSGWLGSTVVAFIGAVGVLFVLRPATGRRIACRQISQAPGAQRSG
jgi:uncharacterized membrane protein YeaQ/YmgE (transglycosylase-associated protein family)